MEGCISPSWEGSCPATLTSGAKVLDPLGHKRDPLAADYEGTYFLASNLYYLIIFSHLCLLAYRAEGDSWDAHFMYAYNLWYVHAYVRCAGAGVV